MDTAERLLRLLGLLQGRIDWTAAELADRLEVTERTIRRDVTRLRSLGYPVDSLAGPGGGYQLGRGGKLPPLLLDDDEALAMALGLRMASTVAVDGLEDASLSALAKLDQVLPPRLRSRLDDVSAATISAITQRSSLVDPEVLATAASATRAKQRLRFSYVARDGRESERHVEPTRLVHTGRRWYLVAFDLDRDDWRTFRLDRVSRPANTGMPARSREAPDPVELVHRGVAIDAWRHRAQVRLGVPVETASHVIPATIGTVQHLSKKSSRLTIGADDLGWLARFLLGLPFPFVVESPEELKQELGRIGAGLVAAYS